MILCVCVVRVCICLWVGVCVLKARLTYSLSELNVISFWKTLFREPSFLIYLRPQGAPVSLSSSSHSFFLHFPLHLLWWKGFVRTLTFVFLWPCSYKVAIFSQDSKLTVCDNYIFFISCEMSINFNLVFIMEAEHLDVRQLGRFISSSTSSSEMPPHIGCRWQLQHRGGEVNLRDSAEQNQISGHLSVRASSSIKI